MSAPYLLTAEPWIPVWDRDASAARQVSLTEALLRAHRLMLPVAQAEDVAVLRMLAAVYDAAAAPRDTAGWDAAWQAETLDAAAVTAYLEQWAERFDLFHPEHPAFQCGALGEYARGPEALHPGSLGGGSGAWFNSELRESLQPYPADRAALFLLHLLAYDVAGIKRAASGDPAGTRNDKSSGKIYGSQVGPAAFVTHCHLEGRNLKETLLLNLPPQPRAAGDAPVWERDSPPAPVRFRAPTGRLDLLTWPTRRIRLHASGGAVDAVAHHDGDRMPANDDGKPNTAALASRLDPMSAWSTGSAGGPVPLKFVDPRGWEKPWRAALLLGSAGEHSAVVQHVTAAAERGTLPDDLPVRAVLSATVYTNRHQSTLGAIPVTAVPLGNARRLADPAAREDLAAMARYADAIGRNLRLQAVRISGNSSDYVAPRMLLTDLDAAWRAAVHLHAEDPGEARAGWQGAVHAAAERCIDAFPASAWARGELLVRYREDPMPRPRPRPTKPKQEARPAGAGRRGPAAAVYEVFGGRYTLSQLSRHPECIVSYPTLRKRVLDGWDVTEAATTRRAGRS